MSVLRDPNHRNEPGAAAWSVFPGPGLVSPRSVVELAQSPWNGLKMLSLSFFYIHVKSQLSHKSRGGMTGRSPHP